jgi:lambda family phage portal protein
MIGWLKSLFGRAAAAPSPRASSGGGRRLHASYDAAQTTPESLPLWTTTDYLSAKAANNFGVRRTLKIRSRYEAANNSYYRGIVDTVACDLVGTGPRLQVLTPDPAVNRAVEAAWRSWARAISLGEKLLTMKKGKTQDGEGFGILVNNPSLSHAVQLDINVIESDQVTTPNPGFIDYFWVDGVVLDKLGRPIAYHVLKRHPGDLFYPQLNPLDYDTVPVRHVLHWFRVDRPGQVRGVPEITPALELFAKLRRYTSAVIAAAETAADIAAYVKSVAPADGVTVEPDPFDTLQIDRGMMVTLPAGYDIAQLKAEQPTTTYESFVRILLREIARCLGIPLGIALGDHSAYNYSSGRLDHLPYRRQQRVERALCEANVLDKTLCAWLEEAVMVEGLLPGGLATIDDLPHRWFWDEAESIDPQKDAEAEKTDLENLTVTLAELYAQRGQDWEEAIRQRAKELALLKELGIAPVQAPAPAPAKPQRQPEPEEVRRAT